MKEVESSTISHIDHADGVLSVRFKSNPKVVILTLHCANLLGTKTFEEYRDMHCAYITMLIEQYEADEVKDESVKKWIAVTEAKT